LKNFSGCAAARGRGVPGAAGRGASVPAHDGTRLRHGHAAPRVHVLRAGQSPGDGRAGMLHWDVEGGRQSVFSYGSLFFLLCTLPRACSEMKSAQWGFSFKKSNINFLKQLCLYFSYMKCMVYKKLIYLSKRGNSFCIFSILKKI